MASRDQAAAGEASPPPLDANALAEVLGEGQAPEEDSRSDWHPIRRQLDDLIHAESTEHAFGGVIFFNLILLILESDANAETGPIDDPVVSGPADWLETTNVVLLGIYTLELSIKLFCLRFEFFKDGWCVMDFMIVGSDLVFALLNLIIGNMPKVSVLRCFRLVRLARAIKALRAFPELNALLLGFVCAFKAIFWGMLMVLVILVICSILAVQLVHPINREVTAKGIYEGCERCPRAFETVWMSLNTFTQQLVAGDSWGAVSLPIIGEEGWTFAFFLAVMVTVSMAIMNLILAVIVDSGQQAREQAMQANMGNASEEAAQKLMSLCKGLDLDESGMLTIQELQMGFDKKGDFANTIIAMGLGSEDVEIIFRVLDADGSGTVDYREFVSKMHDLHNLDVRQLCIFIKFYITDMRKQLMDEIQQIKEIKSLGETQTVLQSKTATDLSTLAEAASSLVTPTGGSNAWEPLPPTPKVLLPPEPTGKPGPEPKATSHSSVAQSAGDETGRELKSLSQELVHAMRVVAERTEAHTRILTNLDATLVKFIGTRRPSAETSPWEPSPRGAPQYHPFQGIGCCSAGPPGRDELVELQLVTSAAAINQTAVTPLHGDDGAGLFGNTSRREAGDGDQLDTRSRGST